MSKEQSANYEDHIEFLIALMTKNYAKACDVGNQLLKLNPKDGNVINVLNILKKKNQHENDACRRSSFISGPIGNDSEYEASDNDTESLDDNTNVQFDLRVRSKILSHDMFRWNSDEGKGLDFKQKMHRVILIKVNRKVAK